jgi:arginine/lysine/ornithine decarboxylase
MYNKSSCSVHYKGRGKKLSELPLLEGVLKYVREKNISFCMPGHKGGRGFLNTPVGKNFAQDFLKCDITEVEGVDNLHNPEGIIQEASILLSNYYGSKKSYFLVNGSTSGNLIMIFSSFNEGDKVIVDRNCHKSVFNAIIMRKLQPVYIKSIVSERLNTSLAIDLEDFLNVLHDNKDAKGIIITYPSYYGTCSNLEYVIGQGKKFNMRILVDSAHGAHFGANNNLPKSAIKLGADMVVTSAHKTIASLTQTAYLHVNNGQDIKNSDFYFSIFSSTSPSYLLLCSMDYARFYLEKYGELDYERLLKLVFYYKNKINKLKGIHIVDKADIEHINKEIFREKKCKDFKFISDLDETRYIISLDKGYSGHLFLSYLRNSGIQAEMSDNSNVVLIFSPFNKEREFKKLYEVLKSCDLDKLKSNNIKLIHCNIPEAILTPYEAMNKNKEYVNLKDSLGRVSAENIVPYPPGIPILTMGELINQNCLEAIYHYLSYKVDVLGITDNKIQVVM